MSKEVICGIYKIVSPSGRIYIGQSEDINRRWKLYKGKHILGSSVSCEEYPTILNKSIKKYGSEKHIFEVIEVCEYEKLNEREMFWIEFYSSFNTPHGMNCTKGGGGVKGFTWSQEARQKLSLKRKGQIQWNVGIKATEDHVEKNRQGVKTAWVRRKASEDYYSEEQKSRRSVRSPNKNKAQKEKWNRIKKQESYYSEEQKEKRRLVAELREHKKAASGYKVSAETRGRNSSASLKMWEKRKAEGKGQFTGVALENIRKATIARWKRNKSMPNYEEEKLRISVLMKKGWEKKKNGLEYNSEEQKEKRREMARKTIATKRANGYKLSDEARKNMSEAAKKRFIKRTPLGRILTYEY